MRNVWEMHVMFPNTNRTLLQSIELVVVVVVVVVVEGQIFRPIFSN